MNGSPRPPVLTRSHRSRLSSFFPLHTGPSPHPTGVGSCVVLDQVFLVPPQFERVVCTGFDPIRQHSTNPILITFSRPADGRPSHSGPWLTSSYSHRLDGRRCRYCNPGTRLSLSFVQNRHKLVSLPQEAADHVQIPLFAVPERFVHRALWPVPPSFPIGSRSAPANHAHFKRVTCSRWRSWRSPQ